MYRLTWFIFVGALSQASKIKPDDGSDDVVINLNIDLNLDGAMKSNGESVDESFLDQAKEPVAGPRKFIPTGNASVSPFNTHRNQSPQNSLEFVQFVFQ